MALAKKDETERLLHLIHHWWSMAETREYAIQLLPLAYELVSHTPEMGIAFCNAFDWVDAFLKG
jgi:hypothetical protein